jgi:hypothetical protein
LIDQFFIWPTLDKVIDGDLPVPTGPGLDVEIKEGVFEQFPYKLDPDMARSFSVYATPHID